MVPTVSHILWSGAKVMTLQALSELLSISTEDTLSGSFQVEQFAKELVRILDGRGGV